MSALPGSGMADLITEAIGSVGALEQLSGEWRSLLERSPAATPFDSPEWQLAWWRHIGGGTLRFLTFRRGGRLVGLAPLYRYGRFGEPRTLALFGGAVSDYQNVLAEPDDARGVGAAVTAWLAETRSEWDAAFLDELPPGSPILQTNIIGPWRAEGSAASTCPVLSLPASWEELLANVSGGLRRTLHKADKRLKSAGTVEIQRADADTFDALFGELFRLHRMRWDERGGSEAITESRIVAFHADAGRAMQQAGRARLWALRINGSAVAVLYGFVQGDTFFSYLTGLDPSEAHVSPGVAVLRHAIQSCIGEGLRSFDMLRGTEPYKYLWGATDQHNTRLVLQSQH